MNDRQKKIIPLCDGIRTSSEIAEICGDNMKYVQRTMLAFDLPRLAQAPRTGRNNPSFQHGRQIDRDGYALVSAPLGHPHAVIRSDRKYGMIREHRLMMERKIGRFLLPKEVVDHIDGLRLHNEPSNLRLFASNGEHLKATIAHQTPKWSEKGKRKLLDCRQFPNLERVHTYLDKKRHGDARLLQIILALYEFGIDSPFLLGTKRYLEKAGISDFSHSNLKRELTNLDRKYA